LSQYQVIYKRNTVVWTTDNLIASTNKLSSLIKMTKWHAHVVHMAKQLNMMGGPGPLGLPLNPALRLRLHPKTSDSLRLRLRNPVYNSVWHTLNIPTAQHVISRSMATCTHKKILSELSLIHRHF